MKLVESFTVAAPRDDVWAFFDDLERVARCVPGVEEVELLEDGRLRVRMAQKVGFLNATFDMRMQVTVREPPTTLELTSTGRSVRGAVGELRATNRVEFAASDGDGTRVVLTSDVAMGGMLGSVGQKVMASKASQTAKEFAAALDERLVAWTAGRGAGGAAAGEAADAR